MIVYGASVSYYTGKLETYLRYKGIEYQRDVPYKDAKRIKAGAGAIQHPIIERADGRFMSDTTPMLQSLDTEFEGSSIYPTDPALNMLALLIEDYADEWLWRPAMHYRWSYDHDRELLSRILADELTGHLKLPRFLRVRMIKKRQLTGFVLNDGVTEQNREHVEAGYHRILEIMSDILTVRPFLLGEKPSVADFGMMGPMLRHFGQDPTPAEIMRDTAPAVFEWLGRMWHARAEQYDQNPANGYIDASAPSLQPLLQEIADTHLVQLRENAMAFGKQQSNFTMTVQGAPYSNLPTSRYRVYCLEQLTEHFSTLDADTQAQLKQQLPAGSEMLWSDEAIAKSDYDLERKAPYNQAINVFDGGVPT